MVCGHVIGRVGLEGKGAAPGPAVSGRAGRPAGAGVPPVRKMRPGRGPRENRSTGRPLGADAPRAFTGHDSAMREAGCRFVVKRGRWRRAELVPPAQTEITAPRPTRGPRHAAATRGEVVPLEDRASRQEQRHASEALEQAVGIVMALGRLRAEQARAVLPEVSQRTRIPGRRIAELLTAWVASGEPNPGIRIALEEAIRHRPRVARPFVPTAE